MTKPVYLLDNDRIDFYWRDIVPLLETVPIFSDLYTPEWVYSETKMGHLQIWALSDSVIRGIVVTKIAVYPRAKVFEILAAAGRGFTSYFSEMDSVFEWLAKDAGCTFMRTTARPGVERATKLHGVQRVGTVLMKRVVPSRAS